MFDINRNFIYELNFDNDDIYDCQNNGCQDDICRCSVVDNVTIYDVDIPSISKEIYNDIFDNSIATKRNNTINKIVYNIDKEFNLYCIDRIIRHFKLWDKYSWETNIIRGYYGEEVDSIKIEKSIALKIQNNLNDIFSIKDLNSKIEFLIKLEYGYILPELIGCEYKISEINKNDIIYFKKDYLKSCIKEDYYSDKNYNGIRGIVLPKDDKFRLIDGYHRFLSTDNEKIKMIEVIK